MTIEQALILGITVVTFLVGGIDWLIRRWLQRHRDELVLSLNQKITDLHTDVLARTAERDGARADLAATADTLAHTSAALVATTTENTKLGQDNADLTAKLAAAVRQIDNEAQTQHAHDARVKRALELEGALWTQPTMANTPKFVPLISAARRSSLCST